MKRVLGLLPEKEVEITRKFKNSNNLNVTIYAGSKGWAVLVSSDYVKYEDIEGTAKENFKRAYNLAKQELGELTLIETK
jgi:hypothetical protein